MMHCLHKTFLLMVFVCSIAGGTTSASDGRIRIGQVDMPLEIYQSGSYVLTESLTVTGGPAIVVSANHVTIDLAGHSIRNVGAQVGSSGISVAFLETYGLRVHNGALVNFGDGVFLGNHSRAENLRLSLVRRAFRLGEGSMVSNVQVIDCDFANEGVVSPGSMLFDISVAGGLPAMASFVYYQLQGANRVDNFRLSGIHATDASLGVSIMSVGRGSAISRVQLVDNSMLNTSFTGIQMTESLLTDSRISDIRADDFNVTGLNMTRSMAVRSSVNNATSASSGYGMIVTDSMLTDCQMQGGFSGLAYSILSTGSRASGNLVKGPNWDIRGTPNILRDNHIITTNAYGFIGQQTANHLLVRNSAAGAATDFISTANSTNHFALVQQFPGTNYVFNNNTWANIRY